MTTMIVQMMIEPLDFSLNLKHLPKLARLLLAKNSLRARKKSTSSPLTRPPLIVNVNPTVPLSPNF